MAEETIQNTNIEPKTSTTVQLLDEAGLRELTTNTRQYILNRTRYRITNVVIGAETINITIE